MINAPVTHAGAERLPLSRTLGDLAKVTTVSVVANSALLGVLLHFLG